ncbi:MAG: hypothetical protein H6741_27235 [Alphaproteobacteria bacterium]|nr:hypothetical protein [Alphaproteobacteria bacterium]
MLLLLLFACQDPPCADLSELGLDPNAELQPGLDADFPDFALGVEYIATGVASAYGDEGLGSQWAKTRLEAFRWEEVEPRKPRGGEHDYDWSCPDAQVAEWQQAGVEWIQSYFTPFNPWAMEGRLNYAPKEQHREDFEAWVEALIERYDGDGEDDMPGLVRPVDHWVFGGEWTGFWPGGDADAYLDTLALARGAALEASEDVKLGLVPFFMIDVFEGNEPTDAEIEARWAEDPKGDRHDLASHLALLERPELYDYVNVHSLGDYTELAPTLRWLRAELDARGGGDLPIWIDDAFPMHFLANNGYRPAWYPTTEENYDAVYAVLLAVADDLEGAGPEAAWVRREAARGAVKKAVTALGEGYVGIQLGNTTDWMSSEDLRLRNSAVSLIGAAAMMGMIDVRHPDGMGLWDVLVPGDRRPAWFAFQLTRAQLEGGRWTQRERVGDTVGVRGYHLTRADAELWVLWHEDGALQLPGEAEPVARYTLEVGEGDVEVTLAPVEPGVEGWETETLSPVEGALDLLLDETPVFIRR